MGYYTHYSLETDAPSEFEIIEELKRMGIVGYALRDNLDEADAVKWYNHEKAMRSISKKFPLVLFTLSGEGEESEDMWVKYFKNGKMQTCRAVITYDSFDESKLT
ncbi:MAG: hypothetical protein EOM14_11300 [Clostridia bacterium]|nr:hypothetical protein [Clostridia bacterium]